MFDNKINHNKIHFISGRYFLKGNSVISLALISVLFPVSRDLRI